MSSKFLPSLVLLVMVCRGHSRTLKLGLLIPWTQEWELGPYMGAAVVIGLDEVVKREILPGHNITWEWRDTYCKPRQGIVAAVELWSAYDGVDAYVGGGCSVVCEPVALLSAAWNVPYVSFGCTSDTLSSKYDYPTFTRSVGTWISLAPMFNKLADAFGWERVGLVTTTENIMQMTANAIKFEMERSGKTVIYNTIDTVVEGSTVNEASLLRQKEIVKDVKASARVIILLMYDNDVAQFLLSALDEGMINGQYAFIVLDADLTASNRTDRFEDAKFAYEGVISANLRKPRGDEWDHFTERVRDAFDDSRFDDYPKLTPTDEVDVHAGMLHDAILAWAYGVRATESQGGLPNDGEEVARNIFNSSFLGITGNVSIDENGDRKPDYSVAIINSDSFVTMFDYLAFSESLVPVPVGDVEWSGGAESPPSDSPSCGWYDELCPDNSQISLIAVGASLAALFLLIALGALYGYRRLRFEAALNAINLWKIDWNEVRTVTGGRAGYNRMSISRMSLKSSKSDASKQVFAEVGVYKGKRVALKKINKHGVNIQDRKILLELKQMRDMNHENINPFVGACVVHPNVCIVMLYAQKGSLQDILLNDALNLNKDFKISIASDIAKGMEYLHDSVIVSHGRLTSSNCVVDSRWTCKVTDYGMKYFRSGHRKEELTEVKLCAGLLWTAPELLRLKQRPAYGTQKGDIYSYAIILQEIAQRDSPFSVQATEMEPPEIIKRVKDGKDPVFRPFVTARNMGHEWLGMMHRCWAEDPLSRPAFSLIKGMLRCINGGKNINVVDQMLKMLEQYAENLEDLVSERTSELDEEKGKVETLLYNILPRSVADQLKQGKQVIPESFDAVTIYFSDIVSFTALSAESTPIQVVRLLNELYSLFDEVSDKHDVYKVETIGDAYMVVSGLPERNGDRHASEVAAMSLNLLEAIAVFKIPHLSQRRLQLRIGLHTGPCVAGVVGMKMPRFCLFGDTVNTASRMESNSEALRIHVSTSTAELLQAVGCFQLECRGSIEVRGKGSMVTYWLNGQTEPLPSLDVSTDVSNRQDRDDLTVTTYL